MWNGSINGRPMLKEQPVRSPLDTLWNTYGKPKPTFKMRFIDWMLR